MYIITCILRTLAALDLQTYHVPEDWQWFEPGLDMDCIPAGHTLSRAAVPLDLFG